jgi:hypothetical protein
MAAVDPDDDDAALRWEGDDDRIGAVPVREPVPETGDATASAPRQTASALLVGYGVLAGIALISTVGWVVTMFRLPSTAFGLLEQIMGQLGELLAIAAPALWFVTVFALTRGRRPITRVVLLLVGLAVVAPWPLLLGVA